MFKWFWTIFSLGAPDNGWLGMKVLFWARDGKESNTVGRNIIHLKIYGNFETRIGSEEAETFERMGNSMKANMNFMKTCPPVRQTL